MSNLVLLLSFFGVCFAVTPLQTTPHYKIYALSDVKLAKRLPLGVTTLQDPSDGISKKTIIEYPYNGTVPADYGGNFGDLEFPRTLKNGTLIVRDTIINERFDQNILLYYYRYLPEYYVEDFKLLNFGRLRGWVRYGAIYHSIAEVEAEILIEAGNQVRIFAEIYTRP